MAMTTCRECGKALSTEAKTCPNCGCSDPCSQRAARVRQKQNILVGAIAVFVGVAALGNLFDLTPNTKPVSVSRAPAPTPAPAPAPAPPPVARANAPAIVAPAAIAKPEKLDFGITPVQFRSAYNKALSAHSPKNAKLLAMGPLQVDTGPAADAFQYDMKSANVSLVGTVVKRSGNMDGLMIGIDGGDTDGRTVARALIVTMLLVRTVTGVQEVGDAVTSAVTRASEQMTDPSKTSHAQMIGDYRFQAVGLKDVGIVMTLARQQN